MTDAMNALVEAARAVDAAMRAGWTPGGAPHDEVAALRRELAWYRSEEPAVVRAAEAFVRAWVDGTHEEAAPALRDALAAVERERAREVSRVEWVCHYAYPAIWTAILPDGRELVVRYADGRWEALIYPNTEADVPTFRYFAHSLAAAKLAAERAATSSLASHERRSKMLGETGWAAQTDTSALRAALDDMDAPASIEEQREWFEARASRDP